MKSSGTSYRVIILILILARPCCSQEKLFDTSHSVTIDINSAPSKTAVMDFNKDGFNDIMVTTDKGLVILLNDREGNFVQPAGSPFEAGNKPADIALADFNSDGNIDAAIPNHESDEISLLFGDGKGNFRKSSESSLHLEFNPHAHSAAAGDLNKDNKTDLVVTSFLGSELFVLSGDGEGDFSEDINKIPVPHYPYRNVIIFDIDNDNNPDIITPANNSNAITVLLGNGKGNFTPADYSPVKIGTNPFFVTAADFNGDGYSDIIATNFDDGRISVLPGNEENKFYTSQIKSFKAGQKPVYIAAADFNSDGITDAACINYESNDITILEGNKIGIFDTELSNIPVGNSPYGAAAGDLNGDNRPDIVTTNYESNDITILYNLCRR